MISIFLSVAIILVISIAHEETNKTYAKEIATTSSNYEHSKIFLRQNAEKPNVNTLPSGLQYKIIRTGLGQYHPTYDSPTEIHYEGTLIDGVTIFESTYKKTSKKPSLFQPRMLIKGFEEAMQLMVEGDKWELYIAPDLAYGDKATGKYIKPGDALIYTVEMLEIKGTTLPDGKVVRCNVDTLEKCNDKEIEYLARMKKKFIGNFLNHDDMKESKVGDVDLEIQRIKRISSSVSCKVIDWANRRIRILNQLNMAIATSDANTSKVGKEDEL